MKSLKQTLIFSTILIIGFILFLSCRSNTLQGQDIENSKTSKKTASTIIPLPNMIFDLEKFGENGIKNSHPLTAAEQKQFQLSEIDRPLYQSDLSDFNYYLLKEIYKGKEGKVLLLSRTAEMEAFAWLATYDLNDKLIDFKKVYYDEWAESTENTTSVIKNNKITLSEYVMNLESGKETTKTKVFQIGSDLKFKEVHL